MQLNVYITTVMRHGHYSIYEKLRDPEFRKKIQGQADAATRIVTTQNGKHDYLSIKRAIEKEDTKLLNCAPLTQEQIDEGLIDALTHNSLDCAHYFLEKGANKRFKGGKSFTAAVNSDSAYTVLFMFSTQEDIDKYGYDCLLKAIENGSKEIVNFFIENGVQIHQKEGNALTTAIKEEQPEILEILLQHFTNIGPKPLQELLTCQKQCQSGYLSGLNDFSERLLKLNEMMAILEEHKKQQKYSTEYLTKTRHMTTTGKHATPSQKVEKIAEIFHMTSYSNTPILNKVQQTELKKLSRKARYK